MPTVLRGSDLFDTNTAIGFSTNHDAATGTVTIPSGLEIGTRRLIRKIHPTQGTVTINCTGETFTRAGLASVELNADGDYWLLEKVTATRWELVDGWNTGENANGSWKRSADGEQVCRLISITFSLAGSGQEVTRPYPIGFSAPVVPNVILERVPSKWAFSGDRRSFVMATPNPSEVLIILQRDNFDNFGGNSGEASYTATGRWY